MSENGRFMMYMWSFIGVVDRDLGKRAFQGLKLESVHDKFQISGEKLIKSNQYEPLLIKLSHFSDRNWPFFGSRDLLETKISYFVTKEAHFSLK